MKSRIGRAIRGEMRDVHMSAALQRRILAEADRKPFRRRVKSRFSPLLVAASLVLLFGILAMAVSLSMGRPDLQRPQTLTRGGDGGGAGGGGTATSAPTAQAEPEAEEADVETAVIATAAPTPPSQSIEAADAAATVAVTAVATPEPTPTFIEALASALSPTANAEADEDYGAEDVAGSEAAEVGQRLTLNARQVGNNLLLVESDFTNTANVYDSVISANGWETLEKEGLEYAESFILRLVGTRITDEWREAYQRRRDSGIIVTALDIEPDFAYLIDAGSWMNRSAGGGTEKYAFYEPENPGHRLILYGIDDYQPWDSLSVALQLGRLSFFNNHDVGCWSTVLLPADVYAEADGSFRVAEDFSTVYSRSNWVDIPVEQLGDDYAMLSCNVLWEAYGEELDVVALILPDDSAFLVVEYKPDGLDSDYSPATTANAGRMKLDPFDSAEFNITGWYLPEGLNPDDTLTLSMPSESGGDKLALRIGDIGFALVEQGEEYDGSGLNDANVEREIAADAEEVGTVSILDASGDAWASDGTEDVAQASEAW